MKRTAILIGLPETCAELERQLDLLADRPRSLGWVLTDGLERAAEDAPVLGTIARLDTLVSRHAPDLALVTLPAVMGDRVASIRTRLRRLAVPDRFMPTLEDQLAGVGPRTHFEIDLAALLDRPPRAIDEHAVAKVIRGRRVLVTGAGGSIGSELARLVARFEPAALALMDRTEGALFEIDRQIARAAPQLDRLALLHDVVDIEGTLVHCRALRPEIVFHAAAHKHVPMMEDHPGAAVDNNLFGTRSVADAADAVGTERFVMISTDKAVNPTSIMGATKRLAELYVQHLSSHSSTAFAIVRFGNVLGSSGSVLDIWARQVADGGPLTVTDPRMTRYFMTIPEAAALVVQSSSLVERDGVSGEVFLLDMGAPIRIVDLARRFARMHGLEPIGPLDAEGRPVDSGGHATASGTTTSTIRICCTGSRPGEKLHEKLAVDAECMRPTAHPGIGAWTLARPTPELMKDILCTLAPDTRPADPVALARAIHRLVPERELPIHDLSTSAASKAIPAASPLI